MTPKLSFGLLAALCTGSACDLNQDEVLGRDYGVPDGVSGAGGELGSGGFAASAGTGEDACDLVATPGGPAPRACMHEVPDGATLSENASGETVVTLAGAVIAIYAPCPCPLRQDGGTTEQFITPLGCDEAPYSQDHVIDPRYVCISRFDSSNVRDCTLTRIDCTKNEDCTERPFGRCVGTVSSQCVYPVKLGPCGRDVDCTVPYGLCVLPFNDEVLCYPNGDCTRTEARCEYPMLNAECTGNADCTALPFGVCKKSIRTAGCEYDDCIGDQDCGTGTSCVCDEIARRRVCTPN